MAVRMRHAKKKNMAAAAPKYGLDAELKGKMAAKRDPQREADAIKWIEAVTGVKFGPGGLQENLKSGVTLCKLVNAIKPGSVGKIQDSKMPFVQRENITAYLDACRRLGVPDHDQFVTQDLYEGDNLVQVTQQIFALSGVAQKVGYNKHVLGPRHAEAEHRQFSEDQLKASRAAVPLLESGIPEQERGPQMDKIIRNSSEFEASRAKNRT